jgi:Phosphotransferase enzyme family
VSPDRDGVRDQLPARGGRTAGTGAVGRDDYLWEILGTLWPPPVSVTRCGRLSQGHPGSNDLLVFPNERRAALLVPRRPRRAAAAALRNYKASAGLRDRLRFSAAALTVRAGLAEVLPDRIRIERGPAGPDADIAGHLRTVLGRDVLVSLYIGPARANRKPVLQVLAPGGEVLGFVKVGVGPLTRRLVRAEAEALAFLAKAPTSRLAPPRLLYHGQWRGNEVLVQQACHAGRPAKRLAELSGPMAELAGIRGLSRHSLAQSPYLRGLRSRLGELADRKLAVPLGQALDLLSPSVGTLEFGSWHGDWTPWNMTMSSGRALVWDWERFGTGVPVGFDAVHFWLQGAIIRSGIAPETAAERVVTQAPEILAPFGLGPGAASHVAAVYLAEIAARYLQDGQAEAGNRLGWIGDWLLPALMRHARRLAEPGRP